MKQKLGVNNYSEVVKFLDFARNKNYHLESSKLNGLTPKYVFDQKRISKLLDDFEVTGTKTIVKIEKEAERLMNPLSGIVDLNDEVDVNLQTSCGAQ